MKKIFAVVATAAALASLPAASAAIPGLVDTGAGLAAGAIDTNYAFSAVSGTATGITTGTGTFGAVGSGWPVGSPWTTTNVGAAQWLAPTANTGQSYDPVANGVYDWTLTFNLKGSNARTASISGLWAADNGGVVELNGVALPGSAIDVNGSTSFSQLTGFTANQGFKAGLNTLTFQVINKGQLTGNPTGVLVDFTASNVSPVPEVGTDIMLLIGLAGLGMMGVISRRNKKTLSLDNAQEMFPG
jgi:hypothetical protein